MCHVSYGKVLRTTNLKEGGLEAAKGWGRPNLSLPSHRPLSPLSRLVQPSFPATAVLLRVENIDRIVPAPCRIALVVKHPIEPVWRRLCRISGSGSHDFWTERATRKSLALASTGKRKEKSVPSGISSCGPN